MTTPLLDFAHMEQMFQSLNQQFLLMNKQVSVVVVGYSSLILGGHSVRRTEDIAILNNRERLFYRAGFHILEEHFLMLHPKYKERLHRLWPEMVYLHVHRIDNHDLFLNKFNASRAKDIADLRFMIEQKLVDRQLCYKLFDEWLTHWYNGDLRLQGEFENLWY